MSKGWPRASRVKEYGRTHKEKFCPQWLFSALQGRYKNCTKQLSPNTKEGRSEQKKFLLGEEKEKRGGGREGKEGRSGFKSA